MFPFRFSKASDEAAALAAAASGARYVADINALPYKDIDLQRSTLRVGSLVRMSELAANPGVRGQFPVIAQALELSASAQIRNMASIGGNLMQRPRCLYFRDVSAACNRRAPGSGCAAIDGRNRTHAILGTSDACIATHPSDLAVALTALDATVITRDGSGEHRIPIADFFRQPGRTPEQEHNLSAGETRRSGYLKVRDRESFEFALTSAAVAMDLATGRVRAARVAVGGVGTVPWRLPAVEQALIGQAAGPDLWRDAASHAADGAKPLSENGFKVELVKRTVERQLATVAGLP